MSFATWLLGLRAEQPREYRRLWRIRRRIYRTVAPLTAEIVRSPEPIPFAEIDRDARSGRCATGAAWGKTFDCAWLRDHRRGARRRRGRRRDARHPRRGAGLLARTARCSTRSAPSSSRATCRTAAGKYRPVPHLDRSRRARSSSSPTSPTTASCSTRSARPVFHGAHLATPRRRGVRPLLRLPDARRARRTRPRMPRSRPSCASRSTRAYARFRAGDIRRRPGRARAGCSPRASDERLRLQRHRPRPPRHGLALAAARDPPQGGAHLHARAQQRSTTHRRLPLRHQPAAADALDEAASIPRSSSGCKKAVAAGRMELQGAFWVETDTNLPGGESLVRQALRRPALPAGGVRARPTTTCGCAGCPTRSATTATCRRSCSKSGMDWFQTIKLAWNKVNVFPHRTFTWQGIDGSTVLVHMPPEGDYNSRGAADGLLAGCAQYPEKALNTALLVYGSGDGGGGPGEIHLEVTEREHEPARPAAGGVLDGERLLPRAREAATIAHTHVGELYLETHQGTYTTQAAIKTVQPAGRAQAAQRRGARRDHRRRQPRDARAALARRAAAPVPRHPARLVDRAGQPRGASRR